MRAITTLKTAWRYTFISVALILLVTSVVIPNSVQNITATTMVVCFLLSLPLTRMSRDLLTLLFLHLCSSFVTLLYLFIGVLNGAPSVAVEQISLVYIISPLLWIYITACLFQTLGYQEIIRWFTWLALLSCISVACFFFMFLHYGPDSVAFFKKNSNINLSDGNAAAIMFVYGSLIFLCGGFFSCPEIAGKLKVLVLVSLIVVAITSGRSALMLSIPIGLFFGFLLKSKRLEKSPKSFRLPALTSFFCITLFIIGAFYFLSDRGGVNIFRIISLFVDEVASGGGAARSEQTVALMNGAFSTLGMGAGHGVGVSYIRSAAFPWRYESVWIATLFRVGFIGTVIYMLPFLWYAGRIFKLAAKGKLPLYQKFMFSGFVAAFIAANTNPYIESFVFQWMYVMPLASIFAVPFAQCSCQHKNINCFVGSGAECHD